MRTSFLLLAGLCALGGATAQDTAKKEDPAPLAKPTAELKAALERLKLPGVRINLEERCVDVDGAICIDQGTLELVACTKNSKEHESIVAIEAKARHIHTALLLLGAKSGHPAMRKRVGEEGEERWVDIPPRGGPVDVSLVVPDDKGKPVERPVSDFIAPTSAEDPGGEPEGAAKDEKFPTNTFLFAGSHLVAEGEGPQAYLADRSGDVISIATFGDELLCLPEVHSHENGALLWQANSSQLPRVGTKVTLRLRPKTK